MPSALIQPQLLIHPIPYHAINVAAYSGKETHREKIELDKP